MKNLDSRVTPYMIRELAPNEIFVFGSYLQGQHAGGAARYPHRVWYRWFHRCADGSAFCKGQGFAKCYFA